MKRTVIALILVAIIAFGATILHRSDSSAPISYAEAKRLTATARCNTGTKNIQIDKTNLQAIQTVALSHILDIPAGTQADINFTSYTGTEVSGAILYAKNYGKYNFTLTKDTAPKTEWKFKSFEPCK